MYVLQNGRLVVVARAAAADIVGHTLVLRDVALYTGPDLSERSARESLVLARASVADAVGPD
jgi:hypothetical protein